MEDGGYGSLSEILLMRFWVARGQSKSPAQENPKAKPANLSNVSNPHFDLKEDILPNVSLQGKQGKGYI